MERFFVKSRSTLFLRPWFVGRPFQLRHGEFPAPVALLLVRVPEQPTFSQMIVNLRIVHVVRIDRFDILPSNLPPLFFYHRLHQDLFFCQNFHLDRRIRSLCVVLFQPHQCRNKKIQIACSLLEQTKSEWTPRLRPDPVVLLSLFLHTFQCSCKDQLFLCSCKRNIEYPKLLSEIFQSCLILDHFLQKGWSLHPFF